MEDLYFQPINNNDRGKVTIYLGYFRSTVQLSYNVKKNLEVFLSSYAFF